MRAAAFLLVLLLVASPVLAGGTAERTYVMTGGGRGALAEAVVLNGMTFFPVRTDTSIAVSADDFSTQTVKVGVCHEWTYDDGSHPTIRCVYACDDVTDALSQPPYAHNTTYRVIVQLFKEPHGCGSGATTGKLRVAIT